MPKTNPFKLKTVSVRLVKDAPIISDEKIINPETAVRALGKYLSDFDREVVAVINLNTAGNPINISFASIGSLNNAVAHPREILKSAILSNANCIMLMHNHPAGSLKPSKEDIMLTDRLSKVCDLVGIKLADHLIVGTDPSFYYSFAEKNILKSEPITYAEKIDEINLPGVAEQKRGAR